MRSHILMMYAGVTVHSNVTSFVSEGQHVDCIAITEQPSVFHFGIKQIEKPPKPVAPPTGGHTPPSEVSCSDSLLGLGLKDQLGNALSCPKHTIPMSRLTMDRLTQFPTLNHFLAKYPSDGQASTNSNGTLHLRGTHAQPAWYPGRKFAVGQQTVMNYGGNAWMDLWRPAGDFSTSHQRYSGGSPVQTLEGGWVVYPQHFGTMNSVLYIYWGSGTKGCYNLECPGFVQTDNTWHLGGPWTSYSTTGRRQSFRLQWKLIQAKWWLFMEGSGNFTAVGYYPVSMYGTGQMSRYATHMEFGGEVRRFVGDPWPQMGSGATPTATLAVAEHWLIYYFPHIQNGGVGAWATLSPGQSPPCYAAQTTDGGTVLYYGGEGGDVCS